MLLEVSSDPGGVIWEPFGGLCTAGLASYLTERHAYCAEIEREIYLIAVDRIKSHSVPLLDVQENKANKGAVDTYA